MRTAFVIPPHRTYMYSGYPSEPILAEAAAQQLWAWQAESDWTDATIDILNELRDENLLNEGECGETAARALLMTAYDRATAKEHAGKPRGSFFSQGCTLVGFLGELFEEGIAARVLNATPDNLPSETTLKSAFKDAKVRFTHFGKMADDLGATSDMAQAAYIRGMAIIARDGERAVDVIIPILLPGEYLTEDVFTGILIQIRHCINAGPVNKSAIDQKTTRFFPPSPPHPPITFRSTSCSSKDPSVLPLPACHLRPYISLVMELGVQLKSKGLKLPRDREDSQSSTDTLLDESLTDRPSTPSHFHVDERGSSASRDTHPRYNIFAHGCSGTIYKVIPLDTRVQADYAKFLGLHDFLDEFSKTSSSWSVSTVLKMKAVFFGGLDGFHWIQNERLRGDLSPAEDEVVIATYANEYIEDEDNQSMQAPLTRPEA